MKPAEIYNDRYHRPRYFWSNLRARLNLRTILRHVSINHHDDVLEIGCDRGQMTERLRWLSPSAIGVDINATSIIKSGKEYLYIMDAQHLNFPDQSFDIIISIHAIEHIPDLEGAILGMERVLRPGGLLVLVYPWEPVRGCQLLPQALFIYRSPKICRLFHLHSLTPRRIQRLTQATSLVQRKWRIVLTPEPAFLSIAG